LAPDQSTEGDYSPDSQREHFSFEKTREEKPFSLVELQNGREEKTEGGFSSSRPVRNSVIDSKNIASAFGTRARGRKSCGRCDVSGSEEKSMTEWEKMRHCRPGFRRGSWRS